jgi:hypothetical protein
LHRPKRRTGRNSARRSNRARQSCRLPLHLSCHIRSTPFLFSKETDARLNSVAGMMKPRGECPLGNQRSPAPRPRTHVRSAASAASPGSSCQTTPSAAGRGGDGRLRSGAFACLNLYGCRIEISDSYITDGRRQVPALHIMVTRHLFEKACDLLSLRLRLKGVVAPSPYRPGRMSLRWPTRTAKSRNIAALFASAHH